MNYSSLPEIIALALFLLAYRPIFGRSGAHVNLWFTGWTLILCNQVARFATAKAAPLPDRYLNFLASLLLEAAGLAFLMAAANHRNWVMGRRLIVLLAVGPFVQTALNLVPAHLALLLLPVSAILYLLPLAFTLTRRHAQPVEFVVLSSAFALFGVVTLALHAHPDALRAGMLQIIFTSAACLLLRNSKRLDRAVVLTSFGLIAWGLQFPFLLILRDLNPQLVLIRSLLHIPEYLVLGGSVLLLLEERLHRADRLATHDPLTNLPNRRFLQERFVVALEQARASRTTIACLVIDVDNFKAINDTYGHSAGDAILQALTVRLAWHISPRDVLARTGGDEFTAMLAGVSNEHYLRFVAEAMMSAASVPVQVEGKPVDVRISMGIALSPDDADEIEDLVRMADEAMYRAKRQGGNVLAFASDAPAEDSLRRPPSAQILQMAAPRGIASRPPSSGSASPAVVTPFKDPGAHPTTSQTGPPAEQTSPVMVGQAFASRSDR